MSTVTYNNQPAIHKTRGTIPLAGTEYLYTVEKVLWPEAVERFLETLLIPPTLHVCCGASQLGDVRLDLDFKHTPTLISDAAKLPFIDDSFRTILIDPPYNGKFRWMHDMLSELPRVASDRIIFQHWFMMANKKGEYKKARKFKMMGVYVWQPRTYFGRANLITVYDNDSSL